MTLSADSAERITLLHQAAKRNGSLVSLKDLSRLMPEKASEEELVEAINLSPSLSSRFELKAGYLKERLLETELELDSEAENRRTARVNMQHAIRFVSLLRPSPFRMVAVSGSTSYGSASRSKDLDLFCVAPLGRMWISLSIGLLAARVYRLTHRDAPKVCLSCIMDEEYARTRFSSEQDPLFARDAVETKVVKGAAVYRSLMSGAGWISKFYPFAYRGSSTSSSSLSPDKRISSFWLALNRLLFSTAGRYLILKSAHLNRRMRASGRIGDVFAVRCGGDHLIFESRRYATLRREYRSVLSTGVVTRE